MCGGIRAGQVESAKLSSSPPEGADVYPDITFCFTLKKVVPNRNVDFDNLPIDLENLILQHGVASRRYNYETIHSIL